MGNISKNWRSKGINTKTNKNLQKECYNRASLLLRNMENNQTNRTETSKFPDEMFAQTSKHQMERIDHQRGSI